MRTAAFAALLALASVPAGAATAPATIPTRDVDVTYRMTVPGHVLTQRMRWDVADRLLRVDPPSGGFYMIMDYGKHEVSMVQQQTKRVLQAEGVGLSVLGTHPGSSPFAREGEDTVAGLSCTEWQTKDAAGQPTEICLTADGVLLQVRLGGRTAMVAQTVTYAAQPASVFALPAGWPRVSMPRPGG